MLHHLNEVGDGLCLKFSRQKYSPRPDLCDGIDYELDSWCDLWHLLSTASVSWSLRRTVVGSRSGAKWLAITTFLKSGNHCDFTKCPLFGLMIVKKKHWQIGILIDNACLSNDCAAKAALTLSAIKKKSWGLYFRGQSHSGFETSFHASGSFFVFYKSFFIQVQF